MSILVQEKDIETGDLYVYYNNIQKWYVFLMNPIWENDIEKPIIVVFVAKYLPTDQRF